MKTHKLKTWPEYFSAIAQGQKSFELRFNDRNFQLGDILELKEWHPSQKKYTGRTMLKRVTYILEGFKGIESDYVIMSIKDFE